MRAGKGRNRDFVVAIFLLLVNVLFFWRVILGGKVLLPFDNLFAFPPWQFSAQQLGVTVPHNTLLSDLILENYAWKRFIVDSLRAREMPLWNPFLFAGVPFLAAGQHSALYPLSLLFYILPIAKAYGYFTVLQLSLAGLFMYIYLRVIGAGRWGALVAGVSYMLSGFMIVSIVFPMIIAAAAWLPLILTAIELIVRASEPRTGENDKLSPLPYALLGAIGLGLQLLAGHIEISYYILMVVAFYSLWRLIGLWWRRREIKALGGSLLWLAATVLLGMTLGAVQLVPLNELVKLNFRQDSASYQEIIGWSYPLRQIITFLIPDFFGNPSHHSYFDVFSRSVVPVTRDFTGEPIDTIFWGVKNYVEAGSYIGLLPLFLALLAILARRCRYVWIFACLALLSLFLAFGTPLYGALYYLLPGYKQLHTPFRWVFPYTLSVSILAGLGADWLARGKGRRLSLLVGWGGIAGGMVVLVILGASLLLYQWSIDLLDAFLRQNTMAQQAFADGRMFYCYQFRNLLIFGFFLGAAGLTILFSRSSLSLPKRLGGHAVWKVLALLVIGGELFLLGGGFNPAADPELANFTPEAVSFLQEDEELYRITSLDDPGTGEKIFNPNVGMYYHIADVRGYDSIIPKQYTEFMGLIETQGQLIYNRISPLYAASSLDSPLLDLLNVKYVLTTRDITNPNYTLVYDKEIRAYRNDDYLPRAFFVPRAIVIRDKEEIFQRLKSLNPREVVILEEEPEPIPSEGVEGSSDAEVSITYYSGNEVAIRVEAPRGGFLLLADSYFPGWKAYLATEGHEEETQLYKANYNFRAVQVPKGESMVRFKYSPLSLKLGLYISFMGGVVMVLGAGSWLWGRYHREEESTLRRVAKNSLTPITLSLFNKLIDMAFAMLMLRILKPEGAGRYGFAVVLIGYFEILTRFGLGTLLTREVAKEREQLGRYLGNTFALRMALWFLSLPLMALLVFLYVWLFGMTKDTALAILLFAIALVPSGIADALSSVFNAYEKMEYPAFISTLTTVVKVTLGVIALLMGWGLVGLAGVSIVGNLFTVGALAYLLLSVIARPRLEFDSTFSREMLGTSYPLMLNHLLATVFFRADVMLLKPAKGDIVVGWYTTAYKFIEGLNVIPAYFTMAIFPIMSRYAAGARDSLLRAYVLSLRLLLTLSLPIAVGTTLLAPKFIAILGGAEYLPHSAIALQLLIWSIPFGFINSVTQYVLIALDEQRFLTKSFLIATSFNILANLLFIPRFSYVASSVITILSEIILLIPFYHCLRKHLASVPFLEISWRPLLAAAMMGGLTWWVRESNLLLVIPLAGLVYVVSLVLVGGISQEELTLIRQFLPSRRIKEELHPEGR